VLEAVYRFPLPGDAAVTAVRVRFGDAEIRAELKERQQAEADYDRAKEQGRQAALATREAPDVFTLQVAGIRPDQEVTVETSYVQLARPEGPGWSLRIPLTTAPRYDRSDEAGTRPAAAAGPAARPRPPLRPRPGRAWRRDGREPHPPAGADPRGGPPAGAAA
jgi:Ca-activated chloride channel family protein